MLAKNVDPDQMPHYVESDLAFDRGLHCLPMTLFPVFSKNGLRHVSSFVLNEETLECNCSLKLTLFETAMLRQFLT